MTLNPHSSPNEGCLLHAMSIAQLYEPQADDILTDEGLLDVFRTIKQHFRQHQDSERIAKLFFCVSYGLGDHLQFHKPVHEDKIFFKGGDSPVAAVRLPSSTSCCMQTSQPDLIPSSSSSSPLSSLTPLPSGTKLSVSYLTSLSPPHRALTLPPLSPKPRPTLPKVTHPSAFHSYRPSVPPITSIDSQGEGETHPRHGHQHNFLGPVLVEPRQRGYYYQNGRIDREPPELQRYVEQGVMTQASLMRKRRHHNQNTEIEPDELVSLPAPPKKPKIPHRHGEFIERRNKIVARLKAVTMADLEQKMERILSSDFTLAIEQVESPQAPPPGTLRSIGESEALLDPALRVLTIHSNQKPHLDNGMNQKGIHYNADYFRLYLAYAQFQRIYSILFPDEVKALSLTTTEPLTTDERDRERNANMKAYRPLIEPQLTETNWAAFRRNIVVGERIMQLTKVVGQGVLLMTKELSGSKLHLTFTNNEWDDFIAGLESDQQDDDTSLLSELQAKLETRLWFHPDGSPVSLEDRRAVQGKSK